MLVCGYVGYCLVVVGVWCVVWCVDYFYGLYVGLVFV